VASDGTSSYYESFPGDANVWTIDQDFDLVDGHGNQFFYAVDLNLDAVGTTFFPGDQQYSELTFYTPYLGAADGVQVAAVSDGNSTGLNSVVAAMHAATTPATPGTHAAFLNATSNSRLQQTVDLTSVPTGSTILFDWTEVISPPGLDTGIIPGYNPRYSVVIRNTNGAILLAPAHTVTTTGPKNWEIDLSQFAGQKIVLSFEYSSSISPMIGALQLSPPQTYAMVTNVSVYTLTGGVKSGEYVTNGGFDSGDLTGWTTNSPMEVQNMTSGVRTLDGLNIQRSFYTAPNKLWGRWVDVFVNNTASDIAKTVIYETDLGYNGTGVIYSSTTGTKSITAWDAVNGSRDIGWVFGNTVTTIFTSYTGTINTTIDTDIIDVSYNITVPANGGMVAIVNFILMDGTDTGQAANGNLTAKATAIDTEAANIMSHFWTDPNYQYLRGMTQQQIDAVVNFSH